MKSLKLKPPKPGRVIVVEGIDGAGTTTLARRLGAWLNASDHPTLITSQPSPLPSGMVIREQLTRKGPNERGRAALALLFAADRLLLWDQLEERSQRGEWSVCDRSVMSSLVYQASELPRDWVNDINRYAHRADLTLLLDLPAEVAISRIGGRSNERDRFEELPILADFRDRYRAITERMIGCPILTIDATQSADAVFADAKSRIETLF